MDTPKGTYSWVRRVIVHSALKSVGPALHALGERAIKTAFPVIFGEFELIALLLGPTEGRYCLLQAALLNRIEPRSRHCRFPSFFTGEKTNSQRIGELRTQTGLNFRVDSVHPKHDLTPSQSPETDPLRLEHRLFRNPIAKESRGALLLRQLHDCTMLGAGKIALGEFGHLDVRTNEFEIDADFLRS